MSRVAGSLASGVLGLGVVCSLAAPVAAADDPTLNELVEILRQQGVIDDQQATDLASKAEKKQEKREWYDRVAIWADFRARYEGFIYDRDGFSKAADAADPTGGSRLTDRHRARYRARINLSGEVASRATVYFRLVSGSSDPRSTNQTLGSGVDFDSDDVRFDLAYATLSPFPNGELPGVEGGYLATDLGKVKNPFRWKDLGADSLLWDGDITLEGGNIRTKGESGPLKFFANGGFYVVDENSSSKDPIMGAGQLGGSLEIADGVSAGARGTFYNFSSLDTAFFTRAAAGGNIVDGLARGSIQVLEASGFLKVAVSEYFPVQVFGSFAHNLSARTSRVAPGASRQDTAWALGIFIGDKKLIAKIGAAYYVIEANAFPSMFIDSDILDATTNREGWVISLQRQIIKNVDFVYKAYLSDRIKGGVPYAASIPGSDRLRMQADLKFKF